MKTKTKAPVHFRDQVKATRVFKGLSKFQKSIYATGQNFRAIENSFNLIKNVGIARWKQVAQNSHINAQIVEELYENSLEVYEELLISKN